jgi:hypothetical protein
VLLTLCSCAEHGPDLSPKAPQPPRSGPFVIIDRGHSETLGRIDHANCFRSLPVCSHFDCGVAKPQHERKLGMELPERPLQGYLLRPQPRRVAVKSLPGIILFEIRVCY